MSIRELGSLKWFSLYFGMDYWWGQFYIILSFITQLALARTPFVSLLEFFVRLNVRVTQLWTAESSHHCLGPWNINIKCCHNTRRRVIKISLHTQDVIPGQVEDVSSEASLLLIFPDTLLYSSWMSWMLNINQLQTLSSFLELLRQGKLLESRPRVSCGPYFVTDPALVTCSSSVSVYSNNTWPGLT